MLFEFLDALLYRDLESSYFLGLNIFTKDLYNESAGSSETFNYFYYFIVYLFLLGFSAVDFLGSVRTKFSADWIE